MKRSEAEEVSAYDAKTKLSELLRETARGRAFVIRRRGKIVARLLPPETERSADSLLELKEAFGRIRAKQKGTVDVCALVREGRRF